jgi:hypothetical protein
VDENCRLLRAVEHALIAPPRQAPAARSGGERKSMSVGETPNVGVDASVTRSPGVASPGERAARQASSRRAGGGPGSRAGGPVGRTRAATSLAPPRSCAAGFAPVAHAPDINALPARRLRQRERADSARRGAVSVGSGPTSSSSSRERARSAMSSSVLAFACDSRPVIQTALRGRGVRETAQRCSGSAQGTHPDHDRAWWFDLALACSNASCRLPSMPSATACSSPACAIRTRSPSTSVCSAAFAACKHRRASRSRVLASCVAFVDAGQLCREDTRQSRESGGEAGDSRLAGPACRAMLSLMVPVTSTCSLHAWTPRQR